MRAPSCGAVLRRAGASSAAAIGAPGHSPSTPAAASLPPACRAPCRPPPRPAPSRPGPLAAASACRCGALRCRSTAQPIVMQRSRAGVGEPQPRPTLRCRRRPDLPWPSHTPGIGAQAAWTSTGVKQAELASTGGKKVGGGSSGGDGGPRPCVGWPCCRPAPGACWRSLDTLPAARSCTASSLRCCLFARRCRPAVPAPPPVHLSPTRLLLLLPSLFPVLLSGGGD